MLQNLCITAWCLGEVAKVAAPTGVLRRYSVCMTVKQPRSGSQISMLKRPTIWCRSSDRQTPPRSESLLTAASVQAHGWLV